MGPPTRLVTAVAVLVAVALALTASSAESQAADAAAGRIVFARGDQIWMIDPDGSGETMLHRTGSDFWLPDPCWSPNRLFVAFTGRSADARILSIESGAVRTVRKDGQYYGLAWSPGGDWLAASEFQGDGHDSAVVLFKVGGKPYRSVAGGGEPAWSPSGRFLAIRGHAQVKEGIERIDLRRAASRALTHGPDGSPDWSRDGRWITFDRCLNSECTRRALVLARANGSGQRTVARGQTPSWSPDGKHIAFVRKTGDTSAIYVVGRDGSGLRRLTVGSDPDWSR